MQTHRDSDFQDNDLKRARQEFIGRLEQRAEECVDKMQSMITGGAEGEATITEWKTKGVHVRKLPDDEQGILRISVGGGSDTPVPLNYLVFRGSHSKCVDLLRKALIALQEGPEE